MVRELATQAVVSHHLEYRREAPLGAADHNRRKVGWHGEAAGDATHSRGVSAPGQLTANRRARSREHREQRLQPGIVTRKEIGAQLALDPVRPQRGFRQHQYEMTGTGEARRNRRRKVVPIRSSQSSTQTSIQFFRRSSARRSTNGLSWEL